MKKIVILIIASFMIFSCSKNEVITETGKKDFLIQTKSLTSLGGNSMLLKSGNIEGKNDIVLSSQAIGRIGKIFVKQGETVKAGQLVVQLNDTVANYGINVQKAQNLIEKTKINYDSTKVSLDKQIYDSEIALQKLKNSLMTLKVTSSIDVSQAKDNLVNTNYGLMDSKSYLELQKMDNSISKAELDYNNTLNNNKQTIESYKNSINKEYLTQKIFLTDILTFGDKLFNITGLYSDDVKIYNEYLGTKDMVLKSKTKQLLLDLKQTKTNVLDNMNFDNLSEETIIEYMGIIDSTYSSINNFLASLEKTINNSIPSIGQLDQSKIDSFIATTNGYQSQLTVNNSAFVAFKNATTTFLKTYKNTELSLVKQLNILKEDKDIFIKNYDLGTTQSQNNLDKVVSSSQDSIKSLELQIKQTEETIKTAKESKELTLKGLQNSLNDAYISKDIAQKDYNKLNIKASIDGVIGDILVDEGQDIISGTPLLSIISHKASQVELSFKESELGYISVGDKVYATLGEKSSTGTIYSISSVSDDSLNYKVLTVFNEKIQNLGGVIEVSIPIKSESILIPIKNINLVGTNKGILNIYDNGKIVQKEILLGKMYKDNIEFLSFVDGTNIDENIMIITNDIGNYDENKFNLKIEQ